MKYLVFDISNVLYRTFFANKHHDVDTSTGLAHHTGLMSMNKFYKKFKPDRVVMAFDRHSWRKTFTATDEALTSKKYKGNRRLKMTPKEQEKFDRFKVHVTEFEDLMRDQTSVICLAGPELEADDLIGGFVEAYGEDGEDEIIIVSRDRDLAQNLGKGKTTFFKNVIQYDPFTAKEITIESAIRDCLKDKTNKINIPPEHINVDFFLWCKGLKGDTGDYVQSARPGIRWTRILKAYDDDYERNKLLHETWTDSKDGQPVERLVKDMLNEGMLLMNLREQPEAIRAGMFNEILNEMDDPGKFNYFQFMKFLGKYQMSTIANSLDKFTDMLSR
jgi:hypothetical protein